MGNSRLSEKEALITFSRMAIKLARKYSTFYEFDDLFQIAQISIVEAVRSYDSKRGASLSTHIYNSIDFNIIIAKECQPSPIENFLRLALTKLITKAKKI